MSNGIEALEQTEFDVIVLGTGLIESMVAGALARVGKSVLHLDSNAYYGSHWAVRNFTEMLRWVRRQQVEPLKTRRDSDESGCSIDYKSMSLANYRHVSFELYETRSTNNDDSSTFIELSVNDNQNEEEAVYEQLRSRLLTIEEKFVDKELLEDAIRKESASVLSTAEKLPEKAMLRINLEPALSKLSTLLDLMRTSKSYNLDMAPKLLPCRGELVEILIRSGVGSYLDFKGVDDLYVFNVEDQQFEKVPSSKEDVFSNKAISLIDKRKLMRFLTYAVDFKSDMSVVEGYESVPYTQFLHEKFQISSGKLQDAIVYAIAMGDAQTSTLDGLERTQTFIKSMGRFSKGGYLCPLYGGGSEIAQAFCRTCAVYGGVYVLDQGLASYKLDTETGRCTSVVTDQGQEFRCRWVVAGMDYLNRSWLPNSDDNSTWIARAIVVSETPLIPSQDEADGTGLLGCCVIPSKNGDPPVLVIQESHESMACPDGQYVTYLWKKLCPKEADHENPLQSTLDMLINSRKDGQASFKPKFAFFYQQKARSVDSRQCSGHLPPNVVPCSDPTSTLDFEEATKEATAIFLHCSPDAGMENFFPPAETE